MWTVKKMTEKDIKQKDVAKLLTGDAYRKVLL